MRLITAIFFSIFCSIFTYGPINAQAPRPTLMDSFPVGTGGGALCQAQSKSTDPVIEGMFDRTWMLVCRDASKPIGQLYALRGGADNAQARIEDAQNMAAPCQGWANAGLKNISDGYVAQCGDGYSLFKLESGKTIYFAHGLTAYDNALRLALRTIIADQILPDRLDIATTGSGDAASFARTQAESLDFSVALGEGYRRNNSGNYVEAAQFFDTLQQKLSNSDTAEAQSDAERQRRLHEYIINQALQLSNLGEFEQADLLFGQAESIAISDPVQTRLRRNFRAMHLLNQHRLADALSVLNRPVAPDNGAISGDGEFVEIDAQISAEINGSNPNMANLGVGQETKLTPAERAAIIDAQALQLIGTINRLNGQTDEARANLARALRDAITIRDGRVVSIARLRAQMMTEMALVEEDTGNFAAAHALFDDALVLLETTYPQTNAVNNVRARLAAFLARRGENIQAMALYKMVIISATENNIGTTGLTHQLRPYFDLLSDAIPENPELVGDLFMASQTLIRPGAADNMEMLSRELLAEDSEAARLFRQSVTLSRDIERARIELARLTQLAKEDGSAAQALNAQKTDLDTLTEQQIATQAALSAYPQFRAVSKQTLTLDDLQSALTPGEAYYKLAVAGDGVYAIYADAQVTNGYKLPLSVETLNRRVSALRETISTWENGQAVTYGFDVITARQLFIELFAPIAGQLTKADHLIFEPDGAMLQLPVNLLVADQAGIDAYLARLELPGGDEFDMRDIAWLGRDIAVSTAISARSFHDARRAPKSTATRQYLGFGNNAPAFTQIIKPPDSGNGAFDFAQCSWPLTEWNNPIADTELLIAANLVGAGQSQIVTGSAFTDDAIMSRPDLGDYRILHFATHGFVTAPRIGCPARPALLTSIGGDTSDGMLAFAEIFDLKIDADIVILSACDTAGQATALATQEAGLRTGGGTSLDGLVRAFIGAGGRAIIASHWPAPDDYQATERLTSGLFETQNMSVAQAMRKAQIALMDDPDTSHPFYWSGFAIIGDGARQFLGGN